MFFSILSFIDEFAIQVADILCEVALPLPYMQAGSIDGKLCSLFSVTTFNLIVSINSIIHIHGVWACSEFGPA
jgi:hypothetical protein